MKTLRILIGILIIGGLATGLWCWQQRSQSATAHRLVLYGNVDIRQVQLAFNDSERIVALHAQEGDHVQTGQLLATLDTRRFASGVADGEARVAAQRQIVARLEAGNRPQEIAKAKAEMEAARADFENAQLNYGRITNLVAQTVETPQRLDSARAALEVARARLAAAKETYDLMVLGPRQEDIAAAQATLRSLEAQLDLAQQNLANAKLDAPTNGVIENRLLELGDMASPQKPVFTLALDDPVWVRAYVPETDLGRIRLGLGATITTDSFPGKQYDGWIGYISPTAEFTPKSVETAEVRTKLVYQVRIFARNPQGELRLGMPAAVTIPLDQSGVTAAGPDVKHD